MQKFWNFPYLKKTQPIFIYNRYKTIKFMNKDKLSQYVTQEINEALRAAKLTFLIKSEIIQAAKILAESILSGGKAIICGNGGSAAEAQHMAAELVGRFEIERPGIPAVSITSDTAILTSASNDYSFDLVYARQIEALGDDKDVLICFSTSGNSENIVQALKTAKTKGMTAILIAGESAGKSKNLADVEIKVKSSRTCRIQEIHSVITHIICGFVEKEICRGKKQQTFE